MGGYKSHTGLVVAWRKLFRCGHLSNLKPEDKTTLNQLGITHIHDLRREDEQVRHPTDIPGLILNLDYQVTFGSTGPLMEMALGEILTADKARKLMTELYAKAVHTTTLALGLFLKNLVAQNGSGMIVHCTAGKDRTGVAAAALLMALGVDEPTIIEDYLLTQQHGNTEHITALVMQKLVQNGVKDLHPSDLQPYCSVEEQYIASFFRELGNTYGGHENYLINGLGITPAEITTLQQNYLE